jgi:hypothetical protein
MADITGPIHTLPGAAYAVPAGMMCDYHPERPATQRRQGETDSFGSERHDLCEECAAEFRPYRADSCDWCKEPATDCRATRDYEEGMRGPVYYVCGACRKRRNDRLDEEARERGDDDGYWDEPDDDYVEERQEIFADVEDDYTPPPRRLIPILCRCGQKWEPGHRCRARKLIGADLRDGRS